MGRKFEIAIRLDLAEEEQSVMLYHEVLEAATVVSANPPPAVIDFNEGDFERAAYSAHAQFGVASIENLNRVLKLYGFKEH